jgi:anti-sigma B factor antagonist
MTSVPDFDFTVAEEEGRVEVRLIGDLDIATAPLLREGLLGVLEGDPRQITLDMADLSFIDSTGLSVVVGAFNRARQDGREVVLRNPRPPTRKVLEISGIDTVMRIV